MANNISATIKSNANFGALSVGDCYAPATNPNIAYIKVGDGAHAVNLADGTESTPDLALAVVYLSSVTIVAA